MAKGSGGGAGRGGGGGKMSLSTARAIYKEYGNYDSAFRAAKKRRDFKVASGYKAKRDALTPKLDQAIKLYHGKLE